MSGSNSSAPDAAARAEPLALTVHSLPEPALDADARRARSGRLKMLLVLLVCAAPVIASYVVYYVVRPQGRTNYAALIEPTRALPALPATTIDGRAFDARSLRGQWLIVAVGPAECDAPCRERLFMQRQLREMLGRERDRVDKVWFVTDAAELPEPLAASVGGEAAMHVLRVPRAALAAWLVPEAGHAIEDHLYVVDPMGEWMMRAPAGADPARFRRDLERLMRASAGWDRPGR
jgi:hypothetical protein